MNRKSQRKGALGVDSSARSKEKTRVLVSNDQKDSKNSSGRGSLDKSSFNEEEEIEHLQKEIEREEKLLKLLEENYNAMLKSSKELEQCYNFIDEESNEWKTRYDNQIEVNRQFVNQSKSVQRNLTDLKNRFKNSRKIENIKDESVAKLHKDKKDLEAELADYKMRLEQEDKAYHAANTERKEILVQLNNVRSSMQVVNMKVSSNTQQPLLSVYSKGVNAQSFATGSLVSDSKNTFLSDTKSSSNMRSSAKVSSNQLYEDDNELFEVFELSKNKEPKNSVSQLSQLTQQELKLPKINA